MSTTWRRGALTLAVVAVVGLAGCTGGDAGDEAVLVDDGGTADEFVTAAVEATVGGSGRIEIIASGAFRDGGPSWDQVATVEYSGEDSLTTSAFEFGGLDGLTTATTQMLTVGGSTYVGSSMYEQGTVEDLPAPSMPDGIEWVDVTADLAAGSDPAGETTSPASAWSSFGDAFLEFSDVTEVDAQSIDGESFRAFEARLRADQLDAMVGRPSTATDPGAPDRGPEWDEREAAVQRYAAEHVWVDATVLVGDDGRLRRVSLEWFDDIAAEFDGCFALQGYVTAESAQLDFVELGGAVPLTAPDPATVMSSAEQREFLYQQLPGLTTTTAPPGDVPPVVSDDTSDSDPAEIVVEGEGAGASGGSGDALAYLSTGEEFMFEGCPE